MFSIKSMFKILSVELVPKVHLCHADCNLLFCATYHWNTYISFWFALLEDKATKMFSLVAVASLKILLGINLGTLAVISSAFFVSVSLATKNSLIPV